MVNLVSLGAMITEPMPAMPNAPARGRVDTADAGAFAKIMSRNDGTAPDSSTTGQDIDLPDDLADNIDGDVAADAVPDATVNQPLAIISNDSLSAAMNEGVGAVLALLVATPPPVAPVAIAAAPVAPASINSGTTQVAAAILPTRMANSAAAAAVPVVRDQAGPGTAILSMPTTVAPVADIPVKVVQPPAVTPLSGNVGPELRYAPPEVPSPDTAVPAGRPATAPARQDIATIVAALRSATEPAPVAPTSPQMQVQTPIIAISAPVATGEPLPAPILPIDPQVASLGVAPQGALSDLPAAPIPSADPVSATASQRTPATPPLAIAGAKPVTATIRPPADAAPVAVPTTPVDRVPLPPVADPITPEADVPLPAPAEMAALAKPQEGAISVPSDIGAPDQAKNPPPIATAPVRQQNATVEAPRADTAPPVERTTPKQQPTRRDDDLPLVASGPSASDTPPGHAMPAPAPLAIDSSSPTVAVAQP
ncbi:MAG: hypothetical protein JWR77_1910, partial [Rhizorhabdus sp.]|nr:hypothetical protein [Rhizorhabdus sp.]